MRNIDAPPGRHRSSTVLLRRGHQARRAFEEELGEAADGVLGLHRTANSSGRGVLAGRGGRSVVSGRVAPRASRPGVVRTVRDLTASGPGRGCHAAGKGATSGCKTLGNRGRFAHGWIVGAQRCLQALRQTRVARK